MPKKRYNAEEIIHKLREADVPSTQGKATIETCKSVGYHPIRHHQVT